MNETALPLVSALCCTRERPEQLERALECFMAQTYPRRELVVVHRTDDPATREVLARYAHEPTIVSVLIRPEEQRSLGDLRNRSIEASRGEYYGGSHGAGGSYPNGSGPSSTPGGGAIIFDAAEYLAGKLPPPLDFVITEAIQAIRPDEK